MEERDLIAAVRSGDENAWGSLYHMHWHALVSYASLISGSEFSKDIVNDVFYKVWLHRDRLLDTPSLKPYLMRSVYNESLNFLRSRSKQDSLDARIEILAAENLDPDNNDIIRKLYNDDARSVIIGAMDQLPPKCREIFCKSYVGHCSHKEIAEHFSLSVSTVDNQIYKALKILRKILSEK